MGYPSLALGGEHTARNKLSLALAFVVLSAAFSGCTGAAVLPGESPTVVAVTVAPAISPTPGPAPTLTPTPSAIPSSNIVLRPTTPADEIWYDRDYSWEYKSVQWGFHVRISKTIYEFYKNSPHGKVANYANYALTDEDREFLREITGKLKANGDANGYSLYDDAQNALVFVQSLPYKEDAAEYTRYPLETLADEAGDCEDKSILAAAILREMGYDVVLLKYPSHMAVGIALPDAQGVYVDYGSSRYFYAETSGVNWNIGDAPAEVRGLAPTVYPMKESPRVSVKMNIEPAGAEGHDSRYVVHCSLKNGGPGTASNLSLHVYALALERGQNKIWVPDRVLSLGDYGDGQAGEADATLTVVAGEKTQIVCVLTGDNVDTNELKSSVFYG